MTTMRVRQRSVIHAEWTKVRSVPSTLWSLLAAAALIVGLGGLYAAVRVTRPPKTPEALAAFDPTAVSLTGAQLAVFAIGILGVLVVTAEFATGTIRSTLAAVPRRLPVLWGKAVALSATTLVLCLPAALVAFLVGQSVLSAEHLNTTLGAPGVGRAVVGSAAYLVAVGLLGLAFGALLRSTAAGIGALFGVLFALPILVGFLPEHAADSVAKFLPSGAGAALTSVRPDAATELSPLGGLIVLTLYVAVALALAAWRLRHRDA